MNEELKVKITIDSKNAQKDIENLTDEVEEFGEETEDTSDKVNDAFSEIGNAAKTGFKAATVAIAAAGAALVGIAESTRDYRTAQGKLVTAFKSAGGSAETATKTYKELNSVLGDSDVAVEAAAHLAKITTNEQELQKWTNICTGVYATFGDSLPIEGLTEAANETIKVGTVTGSLADALNWAGVSEDEFNESLAKCTTEQERQALVAETLNGLYGTAASTYRETNASIIEANKATENWNAQMAKIGGYVEPAITEFKNLGTAVLQDMEEPIKSVVAFITDDFIPGIKAMGNWVKDNSEIVTVAVAAMAAGYVAYKVSVVNAKLAEEGLTIARVAAQKAQAALNLVMNMNPYVLLASAVAAATAALVIYCNQTKDNKTEVEVLTEHEKKLIEAIDEETEAIGERKKAYEESVSASLSQQEYLTRLAEELNSLVDANGKVTESDQTRVNFILNELNNALGTEYQMVDGIVQKYDELKTSITDLIATKTANAMLDAKNEEYIAAIDGEAAALAAATAAQKDYEAQLAKIPDAEAAVAKAREDALELFERGTDAAITSGNEMIKEAEDNLEEEKKLLNEKKAKYDEASTNYAKYSEDIRTYQEAQMAAEEGNYERVIELLRGKADFHLEYADDVDEATRQVVDALYKEAIDTGVEAERIKHNFENGIAGYTQEMVNESQKAHDDALKAWEDAYNEANGIGKDMGDGLGDGLSSKSSALVTKARSLINNIWSAMRSAADSHSPSRKTMALGKDMGAGLEIGIDKSTEKTTLAAKNLIQSTLIPMEASLKSVSWNNLDRAFDTAVNPISNINLNNETTVSVTGGSEAKQPIILQIDGKVLAQTSIDNINQLTRQTGTLQLEIM